MYASLKKISCPTLRLHLTQRVNLLEYNLREEMIKERDQNSPTLEQDVRKVLNDFAVSDISEVRLVDDNSRIVGSSSNQGIVGQRTTNIMVKRALVSGTPDDKIFIDKKTGHRIWVYTSPVQSNRKVIGSIYLVAKIETVFEQLNDINKIFITGTLIALVITAILGILLAQTITRPIADMRKQALAMGRGNFSRKAKVYGYDEIGQLTITFNNLTKRLQEAQATTEGERRKLSSVLSYMTDGVIATDRKGRVILINDPAAKLLNVSRETVLSQSILTLLNLEDEYSFEDLIKEKESVILDYSN